MAALALARRFVAEERADETTSSTVRIAIWVLAALAVMGFVGGKVIYPMLTKANNCAQTASGLNNQSFQTGSAVNATC